VRYGSCCKFSLFYYSYACFIVHSTLYSIAFLFQPKRETRCCNSRKLRFKCRRRKVIVHSCEREKRNEIFVIYIDKFRTAFCCFHFYRVLVHFFDLAFFLGLGRDIKGSLINGERLPDALCGCGSILHWKDNASTISKYISK